MSEQFYLELSGRSGQPSRVGPFDSEDELDAYVEENHSNGIKGDYLVIKVTEEVIEEGDGDDDADGGDGNGYDGKNVEELKGALRARGLPVSGSRDELVDRLREDDASEDDSEGN